MLDKNEIMELIPHQPPFLWVDKITELVPGERCVGFKMIDEESDFFKGHFPGDPVFPGVFIIEACAQTAGIMLGKGIKKTQVKEKNDKSDKRLAAVNRFKFLKKVKPGDELRMETRLLRKLAQLAYVEATASVSGKEVARGELIVAVF